MTGPFFYGHDWIGLYLASDLTKTAENLRFYADFLDGKALLLREQMLLASEPSSPCSWCDGRGVVELDENLASDCPACGASAIEARSGETQSGSTEGESATRQGDAHE